MDRSSDSDPSGTRSALDSIPTGGVSLSDERLRLLAPSWAATYRGLRRMDELDLGETEPATLFVWREEP